MAILVIATILIKQNNGVVNVVNNVDGGQYEKPITSAPSVSYEKYSQEEMYHFWDLHIKKICDQLLEGKYLVAEINERYKILQRKIVGKYGKSININVVLTSHGQSPHLSLASFDMQNLAPRINIFIPAVRNIYYNLFRVQDNPSMEEQFEIMVIVAIMHELDHIAIGHVNHQNLSRGEIIGCESDAWAETCEHTISVFVKHKYLIDPSSKRYYEAWVYCGRERDICWHSYIEESYFPLVEPNK